MNRGFGQLRVLRMLTTVLWVLLPLFGAQTAYGASEASPGPDYYRNLPILPTWYQLPSSSSTRNDPGVAPPSGGSQASGSEATVRAQEATTLTVSIIGSPYATLDNTHVSDGPRVLVVEAVITNTSSATALTPTVVLDFDSSGSWILLPGEVPTRTLHGGLAYQEAFHAYWFATYPTAYGATHQYTVTAKAENSARVATSHNYYNPTGDTVETVSTLSTGNSGVSQVSANVVVGVAFTVSVGYDLGQNPNQASFSPVGNFDPLDPTLSFNPSAYRLVGSEVRFYNDAGTWEDTVVDRLYLPTLNAQADNAEATYTFLALTPSNTRLCPYTSVFYNGWKYDQFFCDGDRIIPITGTITLEMSKQLTVPSPTIQQGESLTYTIQYTNTGSLPLTYAWIWDQVDTTKGSIIPGSADPPSNPAQSNNSRVAWYLGTVPEAGQLDSTGTLTFAFDVDGGGTDLADGALIVNSAFFGISEGMLPGSPALTNTLATTVQAPTISVSKSDGRTTAEVGDTLTYTLRITNDGTVAATGLLITDSLPANVLYVPNTAVPNETGGTGQTLVWDTLGPVASGGGTVVIRIPVTVAQGAPDGSSLVNTMSVQYQNPAGHTYAIETASDTTTVNAPNLIITKSDLDDPVLVGRLITYTLHYTNNGTVSATGVLITDVVPISTTYHMCVGGSSCIMSGGVVSWTVDPVAAASASGAVTFSTMISDWLPTGTVIHNDDYGIFSDQTGFVPGPAETTEVDNDAAFVHGYAFVDTDGDGYRDAGEVEGIEGVTITLSSATVPVITTNGAGYFHFRIERERRISVVGALPDGFFRTTPGTIYTDTTFGFTQTVNFGLAPVTSTFGVIYGTVFDDANHDSVRQDELGIPGVSIYSSEAATSPVTTDEYGVYTLRYDISGPVTITEQNPPFYVSTTPDVVHTSALTQSSGPSPVDFGDYRGIRVTGQVFDDADVDGVKDITEGGVPGATVTANGNDVTTGATGVFTLYARVYDSNPILVTEVDPDGYVSTNAIPGPGLIKASNSGLTITNPIAGNHYSGDFGDVLASDVITVSGQVWEDNGVCPGCLANGQKDTGEGGLAGAVVLLSSGLTQTTGSDGYYMLYAPEMQVITVTESNPPGYISTDAVPGPVNATRIDRDTIVISPLSSGLTSPENLFGDVLPGNAAIITGTVFDDTDENGVYSDTVESGLANVTVTLEFESGGSISVQTAPAGNYRFAVGPGTDVRITSAGPGGSYYPTTPESVVARPPSSGTYPNNNFGYSDDTDLSVITGIVFDDYDSNGEQDIGELGLAGAVVSLTLDGTTLLTVTTSGNGLVTGTFSFEVTELGTYVVGAQAPPGGPPFYRPTTPEELPVTVSALGEVYDKADFGYTNRADTASIYGLVFDDLNCNGVRDPDEPALGGVVITDTTTMESTTTKAYGQFSYGFQITEAAFHTIVEDDPALDGYHSTTPDEIVVWVEADSSYNVSFGDTDSMCSVVMGIVFDDWSGDGEQQGAEAGIQGVEVSLTNGIPLATTTGAYGQYTFPITNTGYVTVTETDNAGYHSTTPNTVIVTITSPLNQTYIVNFGDALDTGGSASFFGTAFNDQNANGIRDVGEPPLVGVTVSITGTSDVDFDTDVTNEWGHFTFKIDYTGIYTVTEHDPPSYVSTVAIPGDIDVTVVDNTTLRATVSSLGRDFGNNLFGDIYAEDTTLATSKAAQDVNGWPLVISDTVRYTWQVTNTGTYTAFNVTLTDDLPDGLTLQSYSADLGAPIGTDPILWSIPVLPIDVVGTMWITSAIDADQAGQTITNTGTVTGSNVPDPPPPPPPVCPDGSLLDPETGECPDTPAPTTTLSIAKTAFDLNGPPLVISDTVRYTWQVTNTGTFTAFNVTLTDDLPDGLTLQGYSADLGTPSGTDPILWSILMLAPDAVASMWITATINPDQAGQTITNTGSITSSNVTDPPPPPPAVCPDGSVPDPGTGECPSPPIDSADLVITKSGNPAAVAAGMVVTYTLQYSNLGPSPAEGVCITDTLPLSLTYGGIVSQPAGWSGPSYDPGPPATLIWCGTGPLPLAASGSIIFTGTTAPDAPGLITNTALIAGSLVDIDTGNNEDTAQTTVGIPTLATLYGFVFQDANSNGAWDGWESPIPNVPIALNGTVTHTTDSAGMYLFFTPLAGTNTLVETDLPGYFSTTPNERDVEVEMENSYRVDFGDVMAGVCTCPPDDCEEDDGPGQAVQLIPGVWKSRDFCDDSADWMTFTVTADSTYTITTSSWGQRADTVLSLFDTGGETMLLTNDDLEGTEDFSSQIVWEAPSDGVYYLRVTNQAGLLGCHTDYYIRLESDEISRILLPLILRSYAPAAPKTGAAALDTVTGLDRPTGELGPQGIINHACPDSFEVDDSWEQATPIVDGDEQVHSFDSDPAQYAADKDVVYFDVVNLQTVTFTVSVLTNTQTMMELYDDQGVSLDITGTTQLTWQATEDGRYYLSVIPLSSTFGCANTAGYNLMAQIPPAGIIYLPLILRSF